MKRCNKANNLSLGNKMPKLLTSAVLVLSLAMGTGCGNTDNTPTAPSQYRCKSRNFRGSREHTGTYAGENS